jgi:Homeodomain-like domain
MVTSGCYFDLVREVKNAYNHRLRLVESVRERGIKPTARLFATSTLTVRRWWRRYQQRRYQQHGLSGLQEHSRAPRHPLKTAPQIEQQVVALCRRLPTFGAARLPREFDLPLSHMAIQRVWREHDLLQSRKKKYQRKRDLAQIKARWALFQQISADTKDLDDIPYY